MQPIRGSQEFGQVVVADPVVGVDEGDVGARDVVQGDVARRARRRDGGVQDPNAVAGVLVRIRAMISRLPSSGPFSTVKISNRSGARVCRNSEARHSSMVPAAL